MESLKKVVESILQQTDELNIYLNEYTEVPSFLQVEGITCILAKNALGDIKDMGKFYFANKTQAEYYLTIDDDIIYPDNYVETLINHITNQEKTIVGVHGYTMHNTTVSKASRTVFHFEDQCAADMLVDVLGTGTTIFRTSMLNNISEKDYETFSGAADLFIKKRANEKGFDLRIIERKDKWLQSIECATENLFSSVTQDALEESPLTSDLSAERSERTQGVYIDHLEMSMRNRKVDQEKVRYANTERIETLKVRSKERAQKLEARIEGLKAQVTEMRGENAEKTKELKEMIKRERGEKIRNRKKCQKELLIAREETKRILDSKSYRLGNLFFRSAKSPRKAAFFPINALNLLLRKKQDTHEEVGEVKKEVSEKKYKPLVSFLDPNQKKVDKASVIEQAGREVERESIDAIKILEANLSKDDESMWLRSVNAYLGTFSLSPLELSETSGGIFERFKCTQDYSIDENIKITVIMPAYNAEDTIDYAIQSILNQTWKNLELIIVNDNSKDNTLKSIKKYAQSDERVKYLSNVVNVGPYVSKNLALRISSGDYVTGHDADDWSHPQRLEFQLRKMQKGKVKAGVGRMLRLDPQRQFQIQKRSKFSRDGAMRNASISLMIEREFMEKNIGYWDSVMCGADSEIIERLRKVFPQEIQEQYFITMICLNEAGSLTNDPELGINVNGAISPFRRQYSDSFTQWHKELAKGKTYLNFPQQKRCFTAPERIRIADADIKKVMSNNDS